MITPIVLLTSHGNKNLMDVVLPPCLSLSYPHLFLQHHQMIGNDHQWGIMDTKICVHNGHPHLPPPPPPTQEQQQITHNLL